jgi:alkylated DNA nucleotide flippase Atl1
MTSKRKTWQEKLADKEDLPKFVKLERGFPCYNAVHKMGAEVGDDVVMVNPSEVIEFIKKVPYGQLTTVIEICLAIARKYNVKGCCSLTTGIFIMTIGNAVEEARKENRDLDIPYWRTLKSQGYLNEKFPGGADAHKALLENEGFKVVRKRNRYFVEDFDEKLYQFT